jgi:hypothetical protein
MSTALKSRPAEIDVESHTEFERSYRPTGWNALTVSREDIAFATIRPGVLSVEITIRNAGTRPSEPTFGILRSAPLGAFVPWRSLNVLRIPAINPGGAMVVRHRVQYRPPAALGDANKIPPGRLLTALGLDDSDEPNQGTGLADDVMSLLGRGGLHWAGNLNLFFPGADVERHTAQALRVYPGRLNVAMFIVGGSRGDAYRFRLTGNATEWAARLLDTDFRQAIAHGASASAGLKEDEWHRPTTGLLLLAIEPPASTESGAVEVHVCQQSTGRQAVVEFTMDARADGPGCYVV